jgi:hypothetical protein
LFHSFLSSLLSLLQSTLECAIRRQPVTIISARLLPLPVVPAVPVVTHTPIRTLCLDAHKFDFCTNGTSDSSSSSSNSGSSSSSTTRTSYYASNSNNNNNNNNGNTYANGGENTKDTSQTNRSKQSATSMFFNPMAYILAGSAAVLLVGAVLIRKRVRLSLWRGGKSRTELILLTVKSTGTIATG